MHHFAAEHEFHFLVDSLAQLDEALAAGADIVLLDNMPLEVMAECVRVVNGAAILEASGGVTLATVRRIAETAVQSRACASKLDTV